MVEAIDNQVQSPQPTNKDGTMKTALIFFFAVLSEVTATTALKFSEGFTKLVPSLVVVAGYGLSFYLLALSLKIIPLGTAYALWSGIGIVLTVLIGMVIWREPMDWARGIGITLIIVGIAVINLFSKTVTH
jgi:multidrug transporter EmrE-like cation transporter